MTKNIGGLLKLIIMVNLFALVLLSMPERPAAVEDTVVHDHLEHDSISTCVIYSI